MDTEDLIKKQSLSREGLVIYGPDRKLIATIKGAGRPVADCGALPEASICAKAAEPRRQPK